MNPVYDDQEDLTVSEDEILRALLDAAEETEQETIMIEVARRGKVLFSFRIRGLQESEYHHCHDKATRYKKNRRMGGIKVAETTDAAEYRSRLIYTATVVEDRKRLWDNKEAWKQLHVPDGPSLIDKVLRAGEKEAIIAKIDELSGYNEDLDDDDSDTLEDVLKN